MPVTSTTNSSISGTIIPTWAYGSQASVAVTGTLIENGTKWSFNVCPSYDTTLKAVDACGQSDATSVATCIRQAVENAILLDPGFQNNLQGKTYYVSVVCNEGDLARARNRSACMIGL